MARLREIREPDGSLPFTMADGTAIGYTDRDGSVLCHPCAVKSDADPDEAPQCRPIGWFPVDPITDEDGPETCDSCTELIDPRAS